MRIHVLPTRHDPFPEGRWRPVVIDVLRATSTIVMALEAGVREVVPTETPDDARALRGDGVLLAGERDLLQIDDFDLGNSPRQFDRSVAGRRLVLSTSNGTRALLRAHTCGPVLCAAFLNLSAVVERLAADARDVLVICAGTDGRFSADDFGVAGAIVDGLRQAHALELDDQALVAAAWYRANRHDLAAMLRATRHGRALSASSMADDVELCARIDVSRCVPAYDGRSVVSSDG